MYQTDFICTYKMMDDQEAQDQLYRIQLQQAFNLEQWDDAEINSILEELLPILLSSSIDFKKIFIKAKENKNIVEVLTNTGLLDKDNENSNDDIIFKMLFTYDYFDLIHWCLCNYLRNGHVKQLHLDNLLNALQN